MDIEKYHSSHHFAILFAEKIAVCGEYHSSNGIIYTNEGNRSLEYFLFVALDEEGNPRVVSLQTISPVNPKIPSIPCEDIDLGLRTDFVVLDTDKLEGSQVGDITAFVLTREVEGSYEQAVMVLSDKGFRLLYPLRGYMDLQRVHVAA